MLSETLKASHVVKCIETFYNTVRIQSLCGYISPNECEEEYRKKLGEDTVKIAS